MRLSGVKVNETSRDNLEDQSVIAEMLRLLSWIRASRAL